MTSVEELKKTIADLRQQLENEKRKTEEANGASKRDRIDKMSAEVIDSNPYR